MLSFKISECNLIPRSRSLSSRFRKLPERETRCSVQQFPKIKKKIFRQREDVNSGLN